MTDLTSSMFGQEPVDSEESLASRADRVEQPQDDRLPSAVPKSIQRKMKLLESGKSSTWWRVGKNVGAAMVGAGAALLLASNPVGWGVTAALIGVGAVAAITGTTITLRADLAAADVAAFKASLESGGRIKETATFWTKFGISLANLLESAAFAAAGYFGGAGISAAYGASAFHGVAGAGQAIGSKLATEIALPSIYGVGSILASMPGAYVDHQRNQPHPDLKYQINISEGLTEHIGALKDDIPKSAPSSKFYKEGRKLAARRPDERTRVTVQGPLVRHFRETDNPVVDGHQAAGGHFPPRPPGDTVQIDDRKLLELLAEQNRSWTTKHVKSSGYAIRTIPRDQALFRDGPPKLEDLRQSHNRANCFLVAGIASALIRDGGWRKFEQIMQDNGNGTVTVRLPQADVTVDKTRLVTDQGYSSFDSGADWAHLLEKAIAAYAMSRETGALKAADDGHYYRAFRYLSHVMGAPQQNAADIENSADPQLPSDMRASNSSGEWRGIIEHSLATGQPVAFQTNNNDYAGKLRKRILPSHFYSIIGTATRGSRPGYLVFDPHGISAGPYPHRSLRSNDVATYEHAQHGNSPVFFVATDEAGDLFDTLAFCNRGVPDRRQSESLLEV
jgi:hypothetical protein